MHKEKGNAALWIIIILVVVAGIWYFAMHKSASTVTPSTTTQTNQNPNGPDYSPTPIGGENTSATSTSVAPKTVTVNYTSTGFSPKTVTIKKGDTVTWVNQTTHGMWIASANHPSHTVYDGTSLTQHCNTSATAPLDQCKSGSTFSFTFDKVGTWGYHDHTNPSNTGSVTVTE